MVDFESYQIQSQKHIFSPDHFKRDNKSMTTLRVTNGIMEEASELNKMVSENLFRNRDLTRAEVVDELGDVMWYIGLLMKEEDITMEEVLEMSLEKQKIRFNGSAKENLNKYQRGNGRDDRAEKEILYKEA